MAVALDANAVIGFLDRSDTLHRSAVEAVTAAVKEGPLAISAVTWAEVLTGAYRGHHDVDSIRSFRADLIAAVVPVDDRIAECAAEIRSRTSLRMPDALVLAGAVKRPEITALITGDRDVAKAAKQLKLDVRLLSD